jgi:hypothetical protein
VDLRQDADEDDAADAEIADVATAAGGMTKKVAAATGGGSKTRGKSAAATSGGGGAATVARTGPLSAPVREVVSKIFDATALTQAMSASTLSCVFMCLMLYFYCYAFSMSYLLAVVFYDARRRDVRGSNRKTRFSTTYDPSCTPLLNPLAHPF